MNIDIQLTKHFNFKEAFKTSHNRELLIKEFQSLLPIRQLNIVEHYRKLANILEPYRVENGTAMAPESGWRSERVHQAIYKSLGRPAPQGSWHKVAAWDFPYSCLKEGMKEKLWKDWPGGMGRYSWGIHLDPGPRRRW